jgi:exonuclease III
MVHGGAGSGKSTVIHVMCQYIHQILRKDGDDPDCPYVLLSAFTGGAASNIEGQTLHTLFSFNFGAGYQSLSDKNRDLKRALYKNVQVLIIDEISLVDADMLYKIDMRLREITQKDMPFGNVAIFALGDMMQIKPVKGRYIMQCPISQQFWMAYEIDSLWHKFECIILEKNHRQGEDRHYANMLNRIRIGQETSEDVQELRERVRKENHPDIKKEKGALFIFGTNKKVNHMNTRRLKALRGDEKVVKAICLHKSIKNFKPKINNAGNICNTPFQSELKLKLGAKVMLTYNIDTSDGLTNGARGELIGILEDERENISKLIVKFEIDSFGRERRRRHPGISKKYPGGTSIEKVNFPFSISKSKKSVINTANVIQFPIKLAFACTAHKIQGATIPKPMKLIIYVMDIWMAAVTYVMLSRICALWQLYILDEFDEAKMYPHQQAIEELERLKNISLNNNPTEWEKEDNKSFKIYSLNCRSLKKHLPDILSDEILMKSDVICLQETWLDGDMMRDDLEMTDYKLHLNSQGKGKGVAIYFKKETLRHQVDIKEENLQLSKFTSDVIDLVVLYRSQNGDQNHLTLILEKLLDSEKPLLVVGDFNFCFMGNSSTPTKKYFHENHFQQLVQEPTHIEGNLLDHAYMRDMKRVNKYKTEVHSKYYTDHKGVAILIKRFGIISPSKVID